MTSPRKPQAVYVEWEDSCTTRGWCAGEKDETSIIRSVGLLVSKTKKSITLTTSESSSGNVLDQIAIPLVSVRKFRKLKA